MLMKQNNDVTKDSPISYYSELQLQRNLESNCAMYIVV